MCTIAQDRDTPCWLAGLPERKQWEGGGVHVSASARTADLPMAILVHMCNITSEQVARREG